MNRQHLTGFAKGLLYNIGAVHIARLTGPKQTLVRIIAYHSVGPPNDYCTSTIRVSPQLFDQHIQYLSKYYNVISMDQVMSCIRDSLPFPDAAVAITFDDGYRDNHQYALPILNKYGSTATFYVVSSVVKENAAFWVSWLQKAISTCRDSSMLGGKFSATGFSGSRQSLVDLISTQVNSGGRAERQNILARVAKVLNCTPWHDCRSENMMNLSEIRDLSQDGMTIGSHTKSHAIMSSLSDEEMTDELEGSKNDLEDLLQTEVAHLAFPNGPGVINCNDRTAKLAVKSGYASACTSRRGVVTQSSDPYLLERHSIHEVMNQGAFAFKLEEHRFPYLMLHGPG